MEIMEAERGTGRAREDKSGRDAAGDKTAKEALQGSEMVKSRKEGEDK